MAQLLLTFGMTLQPTAGIQSAVGGLTAYGSCHIHRTNTYQALSLGKSRLIGHSTSAKNWSTTRLRFPLLHHKILHDPGRGGFYGLRILLVTTWLLSPEAVHMPGDLTYNEYWTILVPS